MTKITKTTLIASLSLLGFTLIKKDIVYEPKKSIFVYLDTLGTGYNDVFMPHKSYKACLKYIIELLN